jgi:Putative binding domain, N-terminal
VAWHTANTLGLLVVVSVSAVAAGCASSPVLSTSPSPTKCQVTLSTSTLSVDVAGATGSIVVNTERECAWEGATAVDWIALTSSPTGRGTGQLDFRVLANPDSLARQAAITVGDQRLEINQGAAPCRVSVGTSAFTLGADGGDQAVPVTAPRGCNWTVTSAANWISVPVDSGSGSARLTFTVQVNPGAPRSGRLMVADQAITIAQSTGVPACSYSINPVTQVIAAPGGTGAVAVTAPSGCAWSATSNASWISIQPGSTGAGNGSVTFVVTPNTGPARSGTASVAGQVVTINQAESAAQPQPQPPPQLPPQAPPNLCSYAISPGVASIGATAGSATVAITAPSGCSWTVASQTAWIAVISGASGAGSASVTISISANPGAARSGIVSIAGQAFTVNQAAAVEQSACAYTIDPSSASVGSNAGAGPAVSLKAPAGCAWTSTSDAAWISITSGSSGSGDGRVGFNVTANVGPARSGTITIAGRTFTVIQSANCSYSINPANAAIGSGGGAGPGIAVTATAGCAWTSSSNAAWVSVTSGSAGTGNGSVTFTVAANTGASRSGTVTIAGQTLTVNQAASCSYSINPASALIKRDGGNGPAVAVTATAGCSWTAASNDAWITVTAGASGTGNGSVAFKVSKNDGAQRTGTLTIAGQTFTVTQEKH